MIDSYRGEYSLVKKITSLESHRGVYSSGEKIMKWTRTEVNILHYFFYKNMIYKNMRLGMSMNKNIFLRTLTINCLKVNKFLENCQILRKFLENYQKLRRFLENYQIQRKFLENWWELKKCLKNYR